MTIDNKRRKLSYVGWDGNNNVGDDAIFLATKQLLSDFELVDVDEMSTQNQLSMVGAP